MLSKRLAKSVLISCETMFNTRRPHEHPKSLEDTLERLKICCSNNVHS